MKARTPFIAGALALVSLTAVALAGQTRTPTTHRLEATPTTVAYGYYWAEAKPALRIASGDIIDVDTLLTSPRTASAGRHRRSSRSTGRR